MKFCRKCLTQKPESEFGPNRRSRDRLNYRCRACMLALSKDYKATHREKVLAAGLARALTYRQRAKALRRCTRCFRAEPTAGTLCETCWFKARAMWVFGKGGCDRWQELKSLWDRQRGLCALSGRELTPGVDASVDHKLAKASGGSDDIENLQWVHRDVNVAKSALSTPEFFAMCREVAAHYDVLTGS